MAICPKYCKMNWSVFYVIELVTILYRILRITGT